jgi:hypothetical protein
MSLVSDKKPLMEKILEIRHKDNSPKTFRKNMRSNIKVICHTVEMAIRLTACSGVKLGTPPLGVPSATLVGTTLFGSISH